MSRFIETIHLSHGVFLNLAGHRQRIRRTFEKYYPGQKIINLSSILNKFDYPASGRYRCTLSYGTGPVDLKISQYNPRKITRLIIKEADSLDYEFKYADRSALNTLLEGLASDEDIIIIKNGLITDTSFSNLAFFDGNQWFTPSTPLLNGTKRQLLMRRGILKEIMIREKDCMHFQKCSLINAMLDLEEVELDCTQIERFH